MSETQKNEAPVEAKEATEAAVAEQAIERVSKVDKLGRAYATGRRKVSSARVWIKPGTGKVFVNKKPMNDYFKRPVLQMLVNQPFNATETLNKFDAFVTVEGGGLSGQAGAVRHGISRALDIYAPDLHTILRRGGYLTRDSRVVERKKYGKAKARRSFQFSKR